MTSKQKLGIALVLLAAAEVVLFTRSFGMFFCGDSLYYLSRRLASAGDLIQVLTHVDYLEEYRPLPFVLFSFVYFPLFKLDPFGYHFIPLLFHLANTFLVFRLARRLLGGDRGAFIAALFFGVHWVNFFITYDVTMMTEFTSVFFFLVASLLFLEYLETGTGRTLAGCLVSFVLSLLTKEAAITFVATSALTAVVARGKKDGTGSILRDAPSALGKTLPILAVAALYLVALLALKDWHLFPQRTGHPHHAAFTLSTLLGKGRYLQWTFGIPDALVLKRAAVGRLAIALALAPFVVLFTLASLAGIVARSRITLCGLIWSIATLAPVLFLPNLTMVHYLYLPIVGIALVYGAIAERATALTVLQGRRAWVGVGLAAFFAAANVAATSWNSSRALADSWLSNGSRVAETGLRDLKSVRPDVPGAATLYFLKSTEKDLPWFFDNGRMFNVFYGNPALRTLFADRGARLPAGYLDDDSVRILRFIRPHVYDMTEEFKTGMRETASLDLLPLFRADRVSLDKREGCYPDYEDFDTPNRKPAFVIPVGRGKIGREAIVMLAGARVRIDLPLIREHDRLRFGITMPFDLGDGAEGRIYLEHDGTIDLLYARWLKPSRVDTDRRWVDEGVDLGKYAGGKGTLRLECNSGPDLDVVGDWIAWSGLRLLPAPAALQESSAAPRKPMWLYVSATFIRQGERVILSVGNGANMTIDGRLRLNGAEVTKERWFTADAAGQFSFQPRERGKWEILSIKNSESDEWVAAPAYLVVD